jgi:predicted lipoprotein with Yx(FWY)xxD motif
MRTLIALVIVVTACAGDANTTTKLSSRSGPYGDYVVDGEGRAVYAFSGDANGQSACLTNCATVWPPVTVEKIPRVEGVMDSAQLVVIRRPDGMRQLSYAGQPLYFSATDRAGAEPWAHYAMSFGGRFTLVSPTGKPLPAPK